MTTEPMKGKTMKKYCCAIGVALLAGVCVFADDTLTAPAVARAYGTQLGVLAWQDDVDALSNKVSVVEEWAVGDDIALRVENAGETNATFSVVYTNDVMYSSVQNNSNVLAQAANYTDSQINNLADSVDDALGSFAWGDLTSSGVNASGSDTLYIEKKSVGITGGGNFSRIDASGYYAFTASLGGGLTMQALAATNNAPSTLTLYDDSSTKVFEVSSQSTKMIAAVAGDDMLAPTVDSSGANDVIKMIFPINASEPPKCYYAPTLEDDFQEATAANWPTYISSSTWEPAGAASCYTNTITMVGKPNQGFFEGKIVRAGGVFTNFTSPIGLTKIVINDVRYVVSVETINGKKLMVLEVDN